MSQSFFFYGKFFFFVGKGQFVDTQKEKGLGGPFVYRTGNFLGNLFRGGKIFGGRNNLFLFGPFFFNKRGRAN